MPIISFAIDLALRGIRYKIDNGSFTGSNYKEVDYSKSSISEFSKSIVEKGSR